MNKKEKTKSVMLSFRCFTEENENMKRHMAEKKLSLSELARKAIAKEIKNEQNNQESCKKTY